MVACQGQRRLFLAFFHYFLLGKNCVILIQDDILYFMMDHVFNKVLFFALLSIFFVPSVSKSDMTGGNFHIYADNFSIISDEYSTGGNFGLFSSGGEFSAGIVQSPAVGSMSFTDPFLDFLGPGDNFILDDGTQSVRFWINNGAGAFNGVCATAIGGVVFPVEWTNCTFGYFIDSGGGPNLAQMTDRIAQAINTSTIGIQAVSDQNGTVDLTNLVAEGSDGNQSITDNVVSNNVVFSGMSVSGNVAVRGGFQAMELGAVSLALSTTTLSLGTLSLNAVATADVVATVTSDGGYVLSATEDGNLRSGLNTIDDIAAGNVAIGTEGYGIRTSGADGQQNGGDVALTGADLTIASNAASVSGQATTVTFRAAIDTDTISGAYGHAVTFSLTSSL